MVAFFHKWYWEIRNKKSFVGISSGVISSNIKAYFTYFISLINFGAL